MTTRHSLILLITISGLGVVTARGTDAEKALLQAERELAKAYQESDVQGITRGVMEEYRITNSRGKIATRADDVNEARNVDPKYEIFENHDMDVRIHGDTAVVIGITHAKGVSGGAPFDANFQFTDTFVNDGGRWRLFAGHATRVSTESGK